jgi:predicted dehydrogenase
VLTINSALFEYPDFAVSYESGIDGVPRFDASIEVFAENKTVKICYDTPYVKGLPTTMHIREKATDGAFKDYVVRKTYEDAYTLEMKELYAVVTEDKPIKTTAEDARHDIEIFGMIMKAVAQSQRPVTMPGVNGEVNGGPKGMNGIDGVRRANLPEV